jgi:transcriptional regulator with GAF, ATPase, and Fis domain
MLCLNDGKYSEGYQLLAQWIEDRLNNGDFDLSEPLLLRGYAFLRLGELEQARIDFEAGYALARLRRSLRLQIEHGNYLGVTFHTCGKYQQAVDWYLRTRELCIEISSAKRVGRITLNLGICYYRLGVYSEALKHLQNALIQLREEKDDLNVCRAHIALAHVLRLTRDFSSARKHVSEAYTMTTHLCAAREECLSLEYLGDIHKDEGRHREARRYYRRGIEVAKAIAPEGDLVSEIMRRDGECYVHEGETGRGLEILARALIHVRKLGDRGEEGIILRCLAEGMLQSKDYRKAIEYSDAACTLLEEIDARHEHAIARLVAGEVLLRYSSVCKDKAPRDLLDKAWDHAVIAQGIILKLDIEYWTDAVKRLQSRIMKRRAEELKYLAAPSVLTTATDRLGPADTRKDPQVVIAESRAMQEVLQAASAFAPYSETVLVTGETGTGKDIVAQLVHQQSPRKEKMMVTVNVAAVPRSTFEREFFGHAKGAYSGADSDGIGLAAAANGSTLFLDEIGDLPPEIQVKLLRLLQDGSYYRLGDPVERHADLRIIAATNTDLQKAVAEGRFREDLYFRLAGLVIAVPPLRERTEDIVPLFEHYLSCIEQRKISIDQYLNPASQKLLSYYAWPGNVREVIQVARRAFVGKLRHGRVELVLGSGEEAMVLTGPDSIAAVATAGGADKVSLSRAHVMLALEESNGNRTIAARKLGVSRATLYRRLEKLGLD